jgi:hypothetical protein
MFAGKPIFITGAHRSGTTWTGKTIGQSPQVFYLHEPFNKDYYEPGRCPLYFDTPFRYITQDNAADYYPSLKKTIELQYSWGSALKSIKQFRELAPIGQLGMRFLYGRLRQQQPLIKDPFALFSTEWLVEQFDMTPIILIRHPAAFVGSVKRFSWVSPVDILMQQPLLVRDYLHPLQDEVAQFLSTERTIVELAAQFWRIANYVVDIYRQRHPDWLFVRHEDLSRSSLEGFNKIFNYLSLPYTDDIQASIKSYTSAQNPRYSTKHTNMSKVNSLTNIWSWQERLTVQEVEQIRAITSDVAQLFYSDDDWSQ